ncbi:hypothetical protein ABZV67_19305 [Streptomyces sp. NPDC005065]|uniref:hypothetical protein n=1 Tax=Streptomyces sp. NPDC005065 TaxID=3154461 RepID=UPI0033B39248
MTEFLTPDQVADIYTRAAKIFGSNEYGVRWPYEASGLDRSLRRTDRERYYRELDAYNRQRLVIVEWAERYELKKSSVQCCPGWLTRNTSRRCDIRKCTRYGSGEQNVDHWWLDHAICWTKDGKPTAITASPYDISVADEYEAKVPDYERIKWWLAQDERLSVAFGAGWYGSATTQVVMWRSDRIPVIEPATGDGGWQELMTASWRPANSAA